MTEEHKRLKETQKPVLENGALCKRSSMGHCSKITTNTVIAGVFPFRSFTFSLLFLGRDGLAGISDYFQNLCFAVALWNGQDTILKSACLAWAIEIMAGVRIIVILTMCRHITIYNMYKYPQQAFPYEQLREENKKRTKHEPEYEILDTGIFNDSRYFDVHITYAKNNSTDIGIRISITNRYKKPAPITVVPTMWFYNRWTKYGSLKTKPNFSPAGPNTIYAEYSPHGDYYFYYQDANDTLFTDNGPIPKSLTERLMKPFLQKMLFMKPL